MPNTHRRLLLLVLLTTGALGAGGCRSSGAGSAARQKDAAPPSPPASAAAGAGPSAKPVAPTDGSAPDAAEEPNDAGAPQPEAAAEAPVDVAPPPTDAVPAPPHDPADPTLLGAGEFCADQGCAAAWGLVDEAAEEGRDGPVDAVVEATVEDGRHLWVLLRAPGRGADYERIRAAGGGARWVLWLARLEPATDPEEGAGYRRSGAVRLYDYARAADELERDCEPSVPSELRARDLDGDREVEVTAIAAVAASGVLRSGEECGAVAFLVGADDFGLQARFTREYRWVLNDAGGDSTLGRFTTWRFAEPADDGAPALHVTEVLQVDDEFDGDWGGDEEGTIPGRRRHGTSRREVDCPYAPDQDRWHCPPSPALGTAFFRGADDVLAPPNPWRDASE